ncbi:hypothetical protein GLIP_0233 [Aliiglaciecola lipolytica E3]|uniref:Uncharacterized protein n=1 Tax=Aliiglaciecola lipolytica E3 TaxID=1127673 RepID=K6Y3P9_9ALTE|nr:hypothetical protein GLIP_0233 [Aliiglaciecola lipolytica E3]
MSLPIYHTIIVKQKSDVITKICNGLTSWVIYSDFEKLE